MLSEAQAKLNLQTKTMNDFHAFNKSQVFGLQNAARSFMEYLIINNLCQLSLSNEFSSLKSVLQVSMTINEKVTFFLVDCRLFCSLFN